MQDSVPDGMPCEVCSRPVGRCYKNQPDRSMHYWMSYDEDGNVKKVTCDICHRLEGLRDYRRDGTLTTNFLMDASMAKVDFDYGIANSNLRDELKEFYYQNKDDLLAAYAETERLKTLVTEFETKQWLPKIKSYWNKTQNRGHKAKVGGVEALMWGCAGRVLITLRQGDSDFTMIFDDSEGSSPGRAGIQGIYAKAHIAKEMLQKVTDNGIKFKRDDKVSMI